MRNIPDNQVSTTARFELPEENSATIENGISHLSSTVVLRETQENKEQKTYRTENADDGGLLDDIKSGIDTVSEYLHNTLQDVDLHDGISELTTNIYRGVVDLINFENLSPTEVRKKVDQEYGGIKAELSTRHKKEAPEQAHKFDEKLDKKISADKQYIESLQQSAYQKKAFGTIDRLAKKYGHGVTQSPETLTDAMISIEDTVNKLAPGIGRDRAVTKIKETRGVLFNNALQGYTDQKNYIAIQSLLDGIDPVTNARLNSGDYITAEERDYFQNLAGKGLRREAAYQLLDEVEAQVISTDELLDALQNHPDSSLGQEALSLWQDRKRIEKKVNRDRAKKQRYSVWQNITETNGNVDVTDLPLDLSDEDRDLFISYLNNKDDLNMGLYDPKGPGAKITDVLLYEIKKLQIANPDIFADRDLSGYFRELSPQKIARVIAMQENGLDPKDAASFKMREREALRAWKQVTGRNGYDEPDRQEFINFSIRFGEEIDDFITLEERPASGGDINKIANRMIESDEMISLENVDEALSDGEQEFFENERDLNVDFPVTVSNEEEFNNLIEKQVELPEGVTATFVEDEQTALDDKHTGKPSYNVIFHDADGNLIDGPATMKRLPGETNEQSHLRYVPGEGFLKDQPRNKKQYNLASTAARDYIYGIRGRHPVNEDEEKEIFLLAENIYGIIREEYGDENHISQGEIYTMVDDLAAEGKAPRLNGYKPPTTQLGRDLEKYYKETNVFGRFRNGFMYGARGIMASGNISIGLNHLEQSERFGNWADRKQKQLEAEEVAIRKKAEHLGVDFKDVEHLLSPTRMKVKEYRRSEQEYRENFIGFITRGAEFKELMEQGRRNPVIVAMEKVENPDEFWELMSYDPMGVVGQYFLENLASTAVDMASGVVGGPAASAAVSGSLEHSKVLMEKLEEYGADLKDPKSVQETMTEHGDEIRKDARVQAFVAGAASVMTGWMVNSAVKKPIVQKALEPGGKVVEVIGENTVSAVGNVFLTPSSKSVVRDVIRVP